MNRKNARLTATHWGNYLVETDADTITAVHPTSIDNNPSAIGQSLKNAKDPGCRIAQPSIREGYLKSPRTGGGARGVEPFVEVPWDEALDIAANALRTTVEEHGNEAIFGGSYGWSSAGRFHHAQSQLHRFLTQLGGYTYSVKSYSTGTAQVIIPHVLGLQALHVMQQAPTIEDVSRHAKLIVSFGGISMKNMQINQGGIGNHSAESQLQSLKDADVDVVCISPTRDDMADFLEADWWPVRPNADVALMLGLAHTLYSENLHDKAFLANYCSGFEPFAAYLSGDTDGVKKDADWAAQLCDINADRIRALAQRMAKEPCLLSVSWSLQRTEHGDQPYWMIAVLAAMVGGIGLPGQGLGYGYGCIHNYGFAGRRALPFKIGSLERGTNPVNRFIPVARISDLLLNPGAQYTYDGERLTYPDIKLVYWSGGNPFHHHQDLNRLRDAFTKPDTIIVNDPVWTATARHADIVFPITTTLEREDFAWGTSELYGTPMRKILDPYADSRDDYAVFSDLAERLGFVKQFTQGRSAREWIEALWSTTVERGREVGVSVPDFAEFWDGGVFHVNTDEIDEREFALEAFRRDPVAHPLPTPTGKIEISSAHLASLELDDCGGFPRWIDKHEFLGSPRSVDYPLALNSNQPSTRLHSQYDFGEVSRNSKIKGRECVKLNPTDAKKRDIKDGDIVRLFNDRGATLAAAQLTDRVRPGVVVLPTGAWYDPLDPTDPLSLDVHGNPNVLTRDVGSSSLSQGTSAHSTLIEVERFIDDLPPIKCFSPPQIVERR